MSPARTVSLKELMLVGVLVLIYIASIITSLVCEVRATRKVMKGKSPVVAITMTVVATLAGIAACGFALHAVRSGFFWTPMVGVGFIWLIFLCLAPIIESQAKSTN